MALPASIRNPGGDGMTYAVTLVNPVQAHTVLSDIWPKAKAYLMAGHRLELVIRKETRSNEQNKKMWACLTDISQQVNWYGQKLTPEEWKAVLTASLKSQKTVPGVDGGFVVLGQSTSKMTIAEMSELLELAMAFGAQQGVQFRDTSPEV